MNWKVDHNIHTRDESERPDTMADPEGADRRSIRAAIDDTYVNDMMKWDDRTNRYVPSEHFIAEIAKATAETYSSQAQSLPELDEETAKQMLDMLGLAQDAMESGPFSGFLYGLKDLIVKQLCSTYIWSEHSENIRATQISRGADPASEGVERAEASIEKNRVAFMFYVRLLRQIAIEHGQISLTDYAWANAAKQAAWDFLGFHVRKANNPDRRATEQAIRRRGPDLMSG